MLGAAAVCQFSNAWYIRFAGGLRFVPSVERGTLRRLLALGWPLAAEALALSALRSVDRLVIVGCLANGDEQLGWYKIAIMMGAWAFDQSNLVAGVLFPRLGETLGRTKDSVAVLRIGLRAAELVALGLIPCTAALLVFGVPVVDWLLPAYRPGLGAAAGLITAASLLGISMPLRYALLTIGRTRSVLAVTGVAALLSLGGGLFLLHGNNDVQGASLVYVAWSSAAAAGVLLASTLGLCVSHRQVAKSLVIKVIVSAVYLAIGAILVPTTQPLSVLSISAALLWIAGPLWRIGLAMSGQRLGDETQLRV
jgi:O-antigen/teichoic acid export membrane protein